MDDEYEAFLNESDDEQEWEQFLQDLEETVMLNNDSEEDDNNQDDDEAEDDEAENDEAEFETVQPLSDYESYDEEDDREADPNIFIQRRTWYPHFPLNTFERKWI